MIETSDAIEPVYPAATVVLLRDGEAGLEALLVQRNKALKHMGGMWVFPGGRVDEADYPQDRDSYRAAIRAAIRETREETGLTVTEEQLVYLSHWTTPEGARKRFATWFFLAILEGEQEVEVDGGEISGYRWIRPGTAMAESSDQDHQLRLMPPTYISLSDLTPFADCAAAREGIGARTALVYEPRMAFVDEGICFLYEGDAGYEGSDHLAAGPRHRAYMVENTLEYLRAL